MFGAMIGDIVGSRYEFDRCENRSFPLFSPGCRFTDDTVMTVAVADALLRGEDFAAAMQRWGRRYPFAGYGGKFVRWLASPDPKPYGSWGNGAAMRVSPCGLAARSLEEALELAERSAAVSHDHPEGIRGAKAVAGAVYLAGTGGTREEIRGFIESGFYILDRTLDEIRPGYAFDSSCRGSVPQAIQAFLESSDFEDALRNAVYLGGDSDTIGAITGSIAWAFYSREAGPSDRMKEIRDRAIGYLPEDILAVATDFSASIDTRK